MENEFLMLSGIQHFIFCRRQWAIIHIEQSWKENVLTQDGRFMHERVHDKNFTELRGSVLFSRSMPIKSVSMKISGECDMVELHRDDNGIPIRGRDHKWRIYPVEYKRGRSDYREADAMQLCAQAMCLEEMFVTDVPEGALYFGELHKRESILFTSEMRISVREAFSEMHELFNRGYTPNAKQTKACKNCSVSDICLPRISKHVSASEYIRRKLEDI